MPRCETKYANVKCFIINHFQRDTEGKKDKDIINPVINGQLGGYCVHEFYIHDLKLHHIIQ